ncbi:thioesterase-like superfamily-domain-containing protein [Aspergillus heterothallicus]
MPIRRSKRAGRPRLETDSSATLSSNRRAQVRRAQRTYRQKKDAVFRDATARAERLESTVRAAIEQMAELSEAATSMQLNLSYPEIHASMMHLYDILTEKDQAEPIVRSDSASTDPSAPDLSTGERGPSDPLDAHIQCDVECGEKRLISNYLSTSNCTYAFQESRFARQLQRYSLEHAYRLLYLESGQANPHEIYRVFRLVACVRDPVKTEPRFRKLLFGGRMDPLELMGLPFYTIGGAGTHFPDVNGEGIPIYPANGRLPRRILGLRPENNKLEEALLAYGLDGEWFNCRDVEGYLRQQGADITQGLFPTLRILGKVPEGNMTISYTLDVETFFSHLISGLVILGRAPGFRKTDVNRALRLSVKKSFDNKDTNTMPSLGEQITVERIDIDYYRSSVPPIRMGDMADWAYGGNVLAIAVNAAYATVNPGQHLYSINGHFVRPASPSQNLFCRVERIRDTRTFQTRHLRVFQYVEDIEHICLVATADFHVNEPTEAVMVNYSARPQLPVPSAPATEAMPEKTRELGLYSLLDTMMDIRTHSGNANLDAQKDVPEVITAERFRLHITEQLQHEAVRIAALAFYMDRGLAYIPANHSGYSLMQASACATLDFALRLFSHQFDLQMWHVGERQTCAAGNARALSEGRVFDANGLIANMTQTTILRAKKPVIKI